MQNINRKSWILVALTLFGIMSLILRWTMTDSTAGNAISLPKFSLLEASHSALSNSTFSLGNNLIDDIKATSYYRTIKSTSTYVFLIWNLFLAWIPFLLAQLFSKVVMRGKHWLISLSIFMIWLVFLPNAPYIITDLLHLKWRHPIPHWFDLMTLFTFAYTGLALGLASVYKIQQTITSIISKKLAWIIAMGSLALSGVGIYLGRVIRYNSWDLLNRPKEIILDAFAAVINPLGNPGAGMAWMMGILLCLIYLWEYGSAFDRPVQSST